jgi:hypothetical protein
MANGKVVKFSAVITDLMVPSRYHLACKVRLTALGASIFHLCCHLCYYRVGISRPCASSSALIAVACLCGCCLHYCRSCRSRLHLANKISSHMYTVMANTMKHLHKTFRKLCIQEHGPSFLQTKWLCSHIPSMKYCILLKAWGCWMLKQRVVEKIGKSKYKGHCDAHPTVLYSTFQKTMHISWNKNSHV